VYAVASELASQASISLQQLPYLPLPEFLSFFWGF
jgi:hypothetical protein